MNIYLSVQTTFNLYEQYDAEDDYLRGKIAEYLKQLRDSLDSKRQELIRAHRENFTYDQGRGKNCNEFTLKDQKLNQYANYEADLENINEFEEKYRDEVFKAIYLEKSQWYQKELLTVDGTSKDDLKEFLP